jgi:hypothetical protein
MKLITAALCLLMVTWVTSLAELPPQVYKDLQARSPEALTIRVKSVTVVKTEEVDGTREDITAEACVEAIKRSASGLRVGDTVHIIYARHTYKRPMPGPGQPEIVLEDHTYSAYLAKSEKDATYALGAGGHSFSFSKAK